MGTASVFETARRVPIERVVLCSSGSAYGDADDDPITENEAPQPVNGYGASKVASEAIMQAYARDWAVHGVARRLFQVFGPGRRTGCHIETMVETALDHRPALIPHGPETRCQYIFIDDAVRALTLAIDAPLRRASIYNISGGTSLTLREVADIACGILPDLEVRFGNDKSGEEYRLRDIDLSAAKRDLGFEPVCSLAAGIIAHVKSEKRRRNDAS